MREPAERLGATQFEVLTAAAFAEFAVTRVDVAVVEAGLGGRLDATNVLDARVVALTNVGLDHTDVLGETREQIAAEKLAVRSPGAILVSGEPEWGGIHADDVGRAARAEAFLGHELEATSRSRSRGGSTASARTSSPERTTRPGSSGCSRGCREATTSSSRRSWRTRTRRRCSSVLGRAGNSLVATASAKRPRTRRRRARADRRRRTSTSSRP